MIVYHNRFDLKDILISSVRSQFIALAVEQAVCGEAIALSSKIQL